MLLRKDAPVGSWSDLKGKKLCGTTGAFSSKVIAQQYDAEIASFDSWEMPLLALKNGDSIGYYLTHPAVPLRPDLHRRQARPHRLEGGYHMPLPGIMETPLAIAVKLGEANFRMFMEDIHKDWMKSGRIMELEKKWHVPPTDYAKRMHEMTKSGR